jgi:hypothetical protein
MSVRYTIDEQHTTGDVSLAMYRAAVEWAVARSERFEIRLETSVYAVPADLACLRELGETTPAPEQYLFGPPVGALFVKGIPGPALTRELTNKIAPAEDLPGDLSPVQDVSLYAGARRIYASFDYGSTQLFELTNPEFDDLKRFFTERGLDPRYLVPAPEPIV